MCHFMHDYVVEDPIRHVQKFVGYSYGFIIGRAASVALVLIGNEFDGTDLEFILEVFIIEPVKLPAQVMIIIDPGF